MEFRSARPDVVWAVSQRWLLTCWDHVRASRPLPAWKDVPLDDLSRQLDTLMFLDAVADAGETRFCIRFLGRRLAESYGGDFTGRYLDEAIPPAWRENAMRTYRQALTVGKPVYNVVETQDRDAKRVRMERLLLPFTSNGGGADRILASIETLSIDGRFAQAELGRSPHADGSCALVAVIEMGPAGTVAAPAARLRR